MSRFPAAGAVVPLARPMDGHAELQTRWPRRLRPFAALAMPFAFYLVPLLLGYSWSALGEGHNVLNPPEGYQARLPDMRITVEAWGASVISVPLHARLGEYLRAGELPLWNPYQGLGEQFAAQGDGSPYFPLEIVRALLPESLGNYVTVLGYYLATVFLYLLLRGLGLSEGAAIFGGTGYALSGALTLHLARPNIADQMAMVPVLFWAAARATRRRSVASYLVLAVVAALHALAGFIQIAMLAALLLAAFVVVYGWSLGGPVRTWLGRAVVVVGVFVVGNGLAAWYLLPVAEAMRTTFNKNVQLLSFTQIPEANVLAFFFPIVFGHPFSVNWLPGNPGQIVDWDNLYAYLGTGLLLIAVAGATLLFAKTPGRAIHGFFFTAAIALTLRYVSVAPVAALDLLPILGRQSPKHGTGLMAFCFVVAAAFGVQAWHSLDSRRARWLVLGTCAYFATFLLTLIGRQGGFDGLQHDVALRFTAVTAAITLLVLAGLWVSLCWQRLSTNGAVILLTGLVVGELSVYLPLGNTAPRFLYARLGVFVLVVLGSLLLALQRRWIAGTMFAATVAGYAALIALPSVGLPRQFSVDTPPRFMQLLQAAEGSAYRSFGIAPDTSSIGPLEDISAVGPLAPQEYAQFIDLISTPQTASQYVNTTHFMLAGPWNFSLEQYLQVKPIFDWLGIRYLVLDRAYFNPSGRTDDQPLVAGAAGVRVAYQDDRVTIVESPDAQPKAAFWGSVNQAPTQDSILRALKADPASILGTPKIESTTLPAAMTGAEQSPVPAMPVDVQSYRPNEVQVQFTAPTAGLVVLKDIYAPGWLATLNGQPADLVRVNGLVRGVLIPRAGQYTVRFEYRPPSFVQGLWLAGLIAVFFVVVMAWGAWRRRDDLPAWAGVIMLILGGATGALTLGAYFGPTRLAGLLSPVSEDISSSPGLAALYVPPGATVFPGALITTGPGGGSVSIAADQIVLSGESGNLVRVRADGSAARLTGQDGERVHVVNIGPWDATSGVFTGLDAVDRGGNWQLDITGLQPSNPNYDFSAGTNSDPIPGFRVSPDSAGYTVVRMQDADGPFVRVQATRPSPFLIVQGTEPLTHLDGAPVVLRGQIRAHSAGQFTLTLYDIIDAQGHASPRVVQQPGSSAWASIQERISRVVYPSPNDNFSLGLAPIEAGDWFDLRELSLSVGALPTTDGG